MAVRRLGPRRRAGRGDVYADRHRQAQRRRPAGLARRCARPDRRDAAEQARRTPPLELGSGTEARSGRVDSLPPRRRSDPAPELRRPHHPAAKISLKYPAALGGCLQTDGNEASETEGENAGSTTEELTPEAEAEFTEQKPESDEDQDDSLSKEDPATRRLSAQPARRPVRCRGLRGENIAASCADWRVQEAARPPAPARRSSPRGSHAYA